MPHKTIRQSITNTLCLIILEGLGFTQRISFQGRKRKAEENKRKAKEGKRKTKEGKGRQRTSEMPRVSVGIGGDGIGGFGTEGIGSPRPTPMETMICKPVQKLVCRSSI